VPAGVGTIRSEILPSDITRSHTFIISREYSLLDPVVFLLSRALSPPEVNYSIWCLKASAPPSIFKSGLIFPPPGARWAMVGRFACLSHFFPRISNPRSPPPNRKFGPLGVASYDFYINSDPSGPPPKFFDGLPPHIGEELTITPQMELHLPYLKFH